MGTIIKGCDIIDIRIIEELNDKIVTEKLSKMTDSEFIEYAKNVFKKHTHIFSNDDIKNIDNVSDLEGLNIYTDKLKDYID